MQRHTYTQTWSNFRALSIPVAATLVEYVLESKDIQYGFKMTLASLCLAFACLNTRAPFGVAAVAWRASQSQFEGKEVVI